MDTRVQIPGFATLEGFDNPCAVYLLLKAGRVVYVGKSTNLYSRIGRHWQNRVRIRKDLNPYNPSTIAPIDFDSVMVKWTPRWLLDREEVALIKRFMPEHNRAGKYDVEDETVTWVAALIAQGRARDAAYLKRRQWAS
jgi:hypothetical protein